MFFQINRKLNILVKRNPFLSLIIGTLFSGIGIVFFSTFTSNEPDVVPTSILSNNSIIRLVDKINNSKVNINNDKSFTDGDYDSKKNLLEKRLVELRNREILLVELKSKRATSEFNRTKLSYSEYFNKTLELYENFLRRLRNIRHYCNLKSADCSDMNIDDALKSAKIMAEKIDNHESFLIEINNTSKL